MTNVRDDVLRQQLVDLLSGRNAHLDLGAALEGLEPANRHRKPPHLKSVWSLLEHMRVAQKDILRYTLNPDWVSPNWPEGYWSDATEVTDEMWEETLRNFKSDLAEVKALAASPDTDLSATIPHREGRTYLRQVLLVADHNAYHLGQIVDTRRALGDWD